MVPLWHMSRAAWYKGCSERDAHFLGVSSPNVWPPQLAAFLCRRETMIPLSVDQRQVLATLATAGGDGVAQALLSARGSDATMIAGLVNRGLATLTTDKVLASGKVTVVAMVRITEAGCHALAASD